MKHQAIRLVALVLAMLMLLATVVACTNDTPDNSGNDTPGTSDTPGTTPGTTPDEGKDEDPAVTANTVLHSFEQRDLSDFGEFIIVASSSYENTFIIDQFPIDDDHNGNMVHDALFDRDKMIEEYYGIDIAWDDVLDSQMMAKIANSIRSGDDIYSLVLGALHSTALPMFNNQLLWNLNEVENIDLSKHWWNKNSVEAFTLNDKIFMATGAITNRYVYAPYALLFNSRLLDAEGLPSPYQLIEDNNWTFETFQAMIVGTAREEDGDDQLTVADFYGLAPADDSQTAWFFAGGGRWVEANDKGEFIPVYEEEDNYNLLSEVLKFHRTDDVMQYVSLYDSNTAFKEGRALFHATALGDITMLADMEDKYGIVPLPKYDEDQEEYYSNTNKYINTMALVPSSVVDTETVGLVVESLAAVSQYTSLDKQYETVLLNRQALDAESKANLQLVVESSFYDWGYVLDPAKLADNIRLTMKGTSGIDEFGSFFASIREPVAAELEEKAELFQD